MVTVLIFLSVGIICGIAFHKRRKLLRLNDRLTNLSIYLLLFSLGVSISRNKEVIENIDQIGLQVLLITLGAVSGSVVLAWLTYKYFFRTKDEE